MISRAILLFTLLIGSIWLGVHLSHDPGYLLISVNQWTIETTLIVAVALLIFAFIAFYILLQLLSWITQFPSNIKARHKKRKAIKANNKTRQGLIEFSEGYWADATQSLVKALPNAETPLLNYLTAARAAQEMGDNKLRDDFLREAQQSMPEAKIAVELTQAQLQIANSQWEQALATLKHLQGLVPKHPYVLKLLMNLFKQVKDWPQLIELLPSLKKYQVIDAREFLHLQHVAYINRLKDIIKHDDAGALDEFMQDLPKILHNSPELMLEYCKYLYEKNDYETCEMILRKTLRKLYDEDLLNLYGILNYDKSQLTFAESLLKDNPHQAPLYLCIGRICRHQNLWGKARKYIEESIDLKPTKEAYAELGMLLEDLNDETGACKAYRKSIQQDLN